MSHSLAAACIAALCWTASAQTTPAAETKGTVPRATPAEYPSIAKAGEFTIAADFTGHSVATSQSTLSTEDFVVIEVAIYGGAGARVKVSAEDFSLRVNGKKAPISSQPSGMVMASLKDPEWEPPSDTKEKSKTSMNSGGGGGRGESNEPPAPVKMPFPIRRAMEQRVQKAALPEGDRALPVAGLIFFPYRGKTQNIKSLELLYSGPAGKATLALRQ